jgi:hypothetical protein
MASKIKSIQVKYTCPKTKERVAATSPNFVIDSETYERHEQWTTTSSYITYKVKKCPSCGEEHELDYQEPRKKVPKVPKLEIDAKISKPQQEARKKELEALVAELNSRVK